MEKQDEKIEYEVLPDMKLEQRILDNQLQEQRNTPARRLVIRRFVIFYRILIIFSLMLFVYAITKPSESMGHAGDVGGATAFFIGLVLLFLSLIDLFILNLGGTIICRKTKVVFLGFIISLILWPFFISAIIALYFINIS